MSAWSTSIRRPTPERARAELRQEWRTASPQERAQIEATAAALTVLIDTPAPERARPGRSRRASRRRTA